MDKQRAEEAAHTHARAIIQGDFGTMIRGMTPEGLAKAMAIGNATWTHFSHQLVHCERDGDDFVFHVMFETELGPVTFGERFRLIDGEWKVVDIERVD